MTKLLRLLFIVLVVELIFYLMLTVYIRSLQREKLEGIWDQRHPDRAGASEQRREFVRKSMYGYEKTLKSRLLALVFVLPNIAIAAIIYYVNWQ